MNSVNRGITMAENFSVQITIPSARPGFVARPQSLRGLCLVGGFTFRRWVVKKIEMVQELISSPAWSGTKDEAFLLKYSKEELEDACGMISEAEADYYQSEVQSINYGGAVKK